MAYIAGASPSLRTPQPTLAPACFGGFGYTGLGVTALELIRLTRAQDASGSAETTLTLPYERRIKGRLRVSLDDGREAGLFLERGTSLREGDLLSDGQGLWVRVIAAPETVSSVVCDDPLLFARACYHLGNRHVPLQIEPGRLRYQHDHVLDGMIRGLGLGITVEQAPFEPESGAYSSGRNHHGGHEH